MVQAAAPAKTSRGILIGGVVILLLLLIGGGSWALLRLRASNADPRQQAIRFFDALKAQDWKTVYALSEGAERNFISEAAYESKMRETIGNPLVNVFFSGLIGKAQPEVGQPVIHGNEATVPVTWTRTLSMQIEGKEYYQSATNTYAMQMKKIRGIWKVADDPQGIGGLVALNYHFDISATNIGTPGWQNVKLGGGVEPQSSTTSGQNGSENAASTGSSLPPRQDTGQTPQTANSDAANANATGSPPPPVLEDRTRLGGATDNSGAGNTYTGSGYDGTAGSTNGAGAVPSQQGVGAGAPENGSGPGSAPNTGGSGAGGTSVPSGAESSGDND
ncbi:MAG TPA: hypothetical protein VFA07_15580 [Chthonomonadaceae bacterium]|nr:hypothetical protein [Chthonomonadaceae bacterium]